MNPFRFLFTAAVALLAFNICVAQTAAKAAPLRIAVYVDKGARNLGVFHWLEITSRASNAVMTPVDGEAVRAGVLDSADVLVMPGGSSVQESKSLGAEGREKIRAFVKNGGGYIGTCAGCCLLMESSKCHPDMLNMIPYTFSVCGGKTDLSIMFNQRATELAGIRKGTEKVRYSEGPVPVPSLPVKEADVEVVAYYNSDVNAQSAKERTSMAGQAAAIAGTYGKGRLFAIAVHPEHDYNDHYILRGAFRYVTGREVKWDSPKRKRGQLAVGFMCDDSFGVETARLVQKLLTDGEFDVFALNKARVEDGYLRKVDAVLAPAGARSQKPEVGLYAANIAATKAFLKRGGRIFAWGSAAEAAEKSGIGVTCVASAEEALEGLRAFAAEPPAMNWSFPQKVAKPLKAGIFHDENNSNIVIAKMLEFAPEYELKLLSPEDYLNGTLEGLDLVIQPGGGCRKQYNALGEKGTEALRRFVLAGGKYYGVCAGAFLALQQSRENYPRLGLVPFKGDDPAHYRGKSPIAVELTEEGKTVFEGSEPIRSIIYAGGPVAVPGDPVEDVDVKVLAKYAGRTISTSNPNPVEPMDGKAAIIGGRVGKGKVFLSGPHPEFEEGAFDMVRSGIKYLTGVSPSPVEYGRVRGAMVVRFHMSDKASAEYLVGKLYRDPRFMVWSGSLSHADAVVFTEKVSDADAAMVKRLLARGGRVVVVADTPDEAKAAAKIKGAAVVDSYDKVADALLAP